MKRSEVFSYIQSRTGKPIRVVCQNGDAICGFYQAFWLKEHNGYDGVVIRPVHGTLRGRCVEIPAGEILSIAEYVPDSGK